MEGQAQYPGLETPSLAASYFESASCFGTTEEQLEIKAREIEHSILLLHGRIRGLFIREMVFRQDEGYLNSGKFKHPNDMGNESRQFTEYLNTDSINEERIRVTLKDLASSPDGNVLQENIAQEDRLHTFDKQRKDTGLDFHIRDPQDDSKFLSSTADASEPDDIDVGTKSHSPAIGDTADTGLSPAMSETAALESVARMHGEVAPWWIEHRAASEVSNLCSVCRRINFDVLFHQPDSLEYGIPLGTLQAIVRKDDCSFCRLVVHTSSRVLGCTVNCFNSRSRNVHCELCGDVTWNRYVTRIRLLCLKLTELVPKAGDTRIRHGWIQEIIPLGKRPPEQRRNDSRLVRDQIDMSLLTSWLRKCKEGHDMPHLESQHHELSLETPTNIHHPFTLIIQPCRPTPVDMIALDLTLVDVKRECLVDMPSKTAYIALSYVWGGPQPFQNILCRREELYSPHGISVDNDDLPHTIRDAIYLTLRLGEDYIWLDSLCICQDHTEEKMNQIANMGNIYGQALLTIIAASGSDANAGLPGVRVGSRKSAQRAEHVGGMILVNEFDHPKDIIDQSHWNTRGWTYQEKELCKRYLIFSPTHVSFQCNRTIFKEDSGLRDIAIAGGRALRIRGERQPVWNSYRRAVVEYTKRNLTNASDMINAFLAFASLLRPGFKGDFLFGLPETELDFALLWQPKSGIRRRTDPDNGNPLFPSWSWAGWIGEVEYKWNKHQLDDISRVEWQCWDSEGGNVCFRTSEELRAPRCGDYGDWKYVPNSRGTPYYYEPQNPDVWCLHPTAPKDRRADHVLIQPGSHHLTFRAYTAFFGITSTTRTLPIKSLEEDSHIIRDLDLNGWRAGTIHGPVHGGTLRGEEHEFIYLSRRRYNQMDDGPVPQSIEEDFKGTPSRVTLYPGENSTEALLDDFDHRRYNRHRPWPLYNVMMIGWENGIAFRVAVGVIHVSAFWQARPIRKVITLA